MGARITQDNTQKVKRIVAAAVKEAEVDAAEIGKVNAVSLCPIGEGQYGTHLFQTIEVVPDGAHTALKAGDPSRNVRHTGWVEFGTWRMAAQPYMSPTIPVIKAALVEKTTQNVRRGIG